VLTVLSDAADSPTTMPLSGTGTLPLLASLASLSFPDQARGTTSAPQVVTLSNPSPAVAIALFGIAVSGDFVQTNDCGATIAEGSSCTVTVRFAPPKKGNLKGTLTITSGATTSPNLVDLSGKGI
jgi:hypothetical protein